MTNFHNTSGGRLALLRTEELSGSQRELYEHIQATELVWAKKSGFQAETENHELIGPFNAMLRSPDIAAAILGVASAITKHAALSETAQQVIILTGMGGIYFYDFSTGAFSLVGECETQH